MKIKLNKLSLFAIWVAGFYIFLRFGVALITKPLPSSIINMFMLIIIFALLIYYSLRDEDIEEIVGPIKRFIVEKKFQPYLFATIGIITSYVFFSNFLGQDKKIVPPILGRTIHPAAPNKIEVKGKTYDLSTLVNPYRKLETENKEKYKTHIQAGRKIYYENCVFCHGDTLEGDGMFADGLNPLPANFADSGTIAQLQESYLFWRVAKGGPGLPDEATPWDSAMPAWEKFLNEEEMWQVIMFMYDFTGNKPRVKEAGH